MKSLSFPFALGVVVAGVVFACSSSDDKKKTDSAAGDSPEALFRAIQSDLVSSCGGSGGACHVNGEHKNAQGDPAARWLGPGDPYTVAKGYPGIVPITNDPRDSKLLTQVEHDGPALVTVNKGALFEGVRKWVTAEVAAQGNAHPVTAAFYVKSGSNTVSLALTAGADGAQLTFDADGTDTVFLSNMKVTAGAKGIRMTNATLVILPASGPTIIDRLAGFDGSLTVKAGTQAPFYTGETILPKWNSLNKLKLVFDKFEIADESVPEAGTGGGCKSVDTFVANAVPAFKLDLGDGSSCVTCHGKTDAKPGSREDVAVTVLDLRTMDTAPDAACASALAYVNLKDKPNSDLIVTPSGGAAGDPTHPVRAVCAAADPDGGGSTTTPPCVPQAYATGITAWINNE